MGPQHPSWNALGHEKPITHLALSPTSSLTPHWSLRIGLGWRQFWRDEDHSATAHSLWSASGLLLLGSAEFTALAPWCLLPTSVSCWVQPLHQLCFTCCCLLLEEFLFPASSSFRKGSCSFSYFILNLSSCASLCVCEMHRSLPLQNHLHLLFYENLSYWLLFTHRSRTAQATSSQT